VCSGVRTPCAQRLSTSMGFARERSFFRGLVERYKRASYRTIAPGRAQLYQRDDRASLGSSEVAPMPYARVGRLTRPPADSASGGQASRCRRGCGLGRLPGAWRPAGARMAVACVMSPPAPRPRVRSTRSLDRVPWCSPQSAPGSHRRPVRVREHPAARHWRGPVGYRNDATDDGRFAVVAGRGVAHPIRRRAGMEAVDPNQYSEPSPR
jgi:hypothetical protein